MLSGNEGIRRFARKPSIWLITVLEQRKGYMRGTKGGAFRKKGGDVVLAGARRVSQHRLPSRLCFPRAGILLRKRSGHYKGSGHVPRAPSLSLPTPRLSLGLLQTQSAGSSQTERQRFPAQGPSPDFHPGARLALQIAGAPGKNRNAGRHADMQIRQPNWALKIVIYYLACILAQKTLYTCFMLI